MTSRVDSEETRWFVKAYLKRQKGKKVHGSKQKTSLPSCLLIIWVHNRLGIQRAHRSSKRQKSHQQYHNRPRPIFVAFESWKVAAEVLKKAKMLRDNPYRYEGKEVNIYIEQMYSPAITQERKAALRVRWSLKKANPS